MYIIWKILFLTRGMRIVTIGEILAPIRWTSDILGINPFHTRNGQATYSKLKLLHSIFCVTSCLVLAVDYLKYLNTLHLNLSNLITFVIVFRCCGTITVMMLMIFSMQKYRKNLSDLGRNLGEIDQFLVNPDQRESLGKTGTRLKKIVIVSLVVQNLIFNILADGYTAWVQPTKRLHVFIIYVYPRLVCSTVNITFATYTMTLASRFKMINNIVCARRTSEADFAEKIQQVMVLHKILLKLSRQLNSMYSLHLLMWIGLCFILLVVDLHAGIFLVFFQSFKADLDHGIIIAKNCIVYAFDLIYLSKRCTQLCFEVKHLFEETIFD